MEQCGIVKSIKGEYAEVEVRRTTACETCSAAHVCPSGRKDAVVRALNKAGASEGDSVKLSTPTGNVLGYAFAVFVFPIISAIAAFLIASSFTEEKYALIAAAAGFAAAFAVVFFTVERRAKKRGDVVVITEIETKEDKNVRDDLEGKI